MTYGLHRIYVEGHGPCMWMLALCLQDLTSQAHLPFARFLCACVLGPPAFTNGLVWSQHTRAHVALLLQNFSEKRLVPTFFSFKYNILLLLYWGRRWGGCSRERTVVSLVHVQPKKGVHLFKGNGSNKVPRSLKAETSAGTMSRLLAEFSSVK